jgi:hypothetical protein
LLHCAADTDPDALLTALEAIKAWVHVLESCDRGQDARSDVSLSVVWQTEGWLVRGAERDAAWGLLGCLLTSNHC